VSTKARTPRTAVSQKATCRTQVALPARIRIVVTPPMPDRLSRGLDQGLSSLARPMKWKKGKALRGKSEVVDRGVPFSKPPYAALWKSSSCRIQLVSGFHLGQIWATILNSNSVDRTGRVSAPIGALAEATGPGGSPVVDAGI